MVAMNTLALAAAVLFAGCAASKPSSSEPDARMARLAEKSCEIARREAQCENAAAKRGADEIARVAPDASAQSRKSSAEDERDREISRCRAEADRANDQLSASERAEYELEGQQERDRAALMMTLTASSFH